MYDVIVVGARCAGASTAMLLARKGFRVLLVDRATFPSEIPHGHVIHRHGPRRLQQWGVLDRIVAAGTPPITSWTMNLGDFPLVGHGLEIDGVAMGYAPRRSVIDRILAYAAVEAGAELREGFAVEEFVRDGERITGIRGRAREGGATLSEQATVTIGADGRNSRLARTVLAPAYEATPPVTCWYFSYWSGVEGWDSGLEIHVTNRRVVFAFPTNDALLGVFVGWSVDALPTVRRDIEAAFMAVLDDIASLGDRLRGGRREERYYGATDVPNFLRRPYGPGWALVGDAGCHKDPYLALGMCDAFRDAELLAVSLAQALSGDRPIDDAMAAYEQRRNDATMADYRMNLSLAQFQPPPDEVFRLRAALRGRAEDTRRFYLANQGLIAREAFFNPENLQRIMMDAAASPRAGSTR